MRKMPEPPGPPKSPTLAILARSRPLPGTGKGRTSITVIGLSSRASHAGIIRQMKPEP
jgi:hypothetical protein